MCVKDGKADFVQDHQGRWRITYSTENSLDSSFSLKNQIIKVIPYQFREIVSPTPHLSFFNGYLASSVWMDYSLFNNSSTYGHLGCFQYFEYASNTEEMFAFIFIFLKVQLLDKLLEVKLLSQKVGVYEILLTISKFPSRWSTPIFISTSNV